MCVGGEGAVSPQIQHLFIWSSFCIMDSLICWRGLRWLSSFCQKQNNTCWMQQIHTLPPIQPPTQLLQKCWAGGRNARKSEPSSTRRVIVRRVNQATRCAWRGFWSGVLQARFPFLALLSRIGGSRGQIRGINVLLATSCGRRVCVWVCIFHVNGNCTFFRICSRSLQRIQRFSRVSELKALVGFQPASPPGIPGRPDTSAPL